ncbi:hypothetical protein [Phreatobacter sp.]|uniref:hypothetical protein n=1 Tax=Phreatobacter sp. TaxID=1966341 RepID=UPI003F711C33
MSLRILNPKHVRTESAKGGDSAQAQVKIGGYREDCLVLLSAQGSASYTAGGGVTTGMILAILVGTDRVAEDICGEGQASSMYFRSSASHNFVLKAGSEVSIAARVEPYGAGNTIDSAVSLSCYALALAPGYDGPCVS